MFWNTARCVGSIMYETTREGQENNHLIPYRTRAYKSRQQTASHWPLTERLPAILTCAWEVAVLEVMDGERKHSGRIYEGVLNTIAWQKQCLLRSPARKGLIFEAESSHVCNHTPSLRLVLTPKLPVRYSRNARAQIHILRDACARRA